MIYLYLALAILLISNSPQSQPRYYFLTPEEREIAINNVSWINNQFMIGSQLTIHLQLPNKDVKRVLPPHAHG